MPMPCFITIKGEKQGDIKGSCEETDREGMIKASQIDHNIHIPTDPQTGVSSGKRIHGPFSFVKFKDMASPKINQALCTGEHLPEVVVKYYQIDPTGVEKHYYTETLKDAIVVEVQSYVPDTIDEKTKQYGAMEKVSLSYGNIKWEAVDDGVEAEDSWKGVAS